MKTEQMINSNVALSGMYKFSIQRGDGTIEETSWMDNMILDSGLDQLGIEYDDILIHQLHIGTGTNSVDATQTSLQSFLASARGISSSSVNKGAPLYQTELTYKYGFAQGSVVGNITEVGTSLAYSANVGGANLFSRCLITDSAGVPTTLSITAADQLIVYYKLTIFPDVTDSSGSLVINGVTYDYVSRGASALSVIASTYFHYIMASPCNESCTGLSPITGSPNGQLAQSNRLSPNYSAYILGSHQLTYGVVFSPGDCIVPIKAIVLDGSGPGAQFVFTPPIPKSDINKLTLTFNRSWGRG